MALFDQIKETVRRVLAEHGASSPSHDTDTLAGTVATEVTKVLDGSVPPNPTPAADPSGAETVVTDSASSAAAAAVQMQIQELNRRVTALEEEIAALKKSEPVAAADEGTET